MIELKTDLPGRRALYGDAAAVLREHGIVLGGGWDFDQGMFDGILLDNDEETIYIRLPFDVLEGMLDEDNALIEFRNPFIIKHILNIGLDDGESPILTTVGLNQFQSPDAPDAPIYNEQWVKDGEALVAKITGHHVFSGELL